MAPDKEPPAPTTPLTRESVTLTLFRMAVPMLAGTFSMNAYNLTDTWFVARLGTDSLAAMSFTFPVVMILRFMTMGLSTGAMALIAQALGGGNREKAARLTTHALVLAGLLAALIMVTGLLTQRQLFDAMGAGGRVLDMVIRYMGIWYGGVIVMTVPGIMGQILMAAGDTRAASLSMVLGTLINLVLDPLLIFGWGPVPSMGISGAALATILSQFFSLVYPLHVLSGKHGLIHWKIPDFHPLLDSWGSILKLGIPNILSNLLTPLSTALVTRLISGYGAFAVAAAGAASRIEILAFMLPMAIGASLIPFVAQNFGAFAFDRILAAQKATRRFALLYGACATLAFYLLAPRMAALFSEDPNVIRIMVMNLRIVCFGYGMLEAFRYSSFCLIGVQKPGRSALLVFLRTFALLVPLSYAGARFFQLPGIFGARLLTDIAAAVIGMIYSRRVILSVRPVTAPRCPE